MFHPTGSEETIPVNHPDLILKSHLTDQRVDLLVNLLLCHLVVRLVAGVWITTHHYQRKKETGYQKNRLIE